MSLTYWPERFWPIAYAAQTTGADLDMVFLEALAAYLTECWATAPAASGTIQEFHVGQWKADREAVPIVTLHLGDPLDENYLSQEQIREQANVTKQPIMRNSLRGGYMETGGGAHWWHRYSAHLQMFFTRTGFSQAQARMVHACVKDWLGARITEAQPNVLHVAAVGHQVMIDTMLVSVTSREDGGPATQWIWRTTLHFDAVVHHDR